MDAFEFFFTIYSLLLGLALAELMLGYANLLRAPQRPVWGWLTPTVGVLIFLQIIVTFLDAWMKLRGVQLNLLGLLVPTLIAVAYFAAAVIAVPRSASEWQSLDEYFHDRKKWILGLLAGQYLLNTLLIELPGFLTGAFIWGTAFTEWVIANLLFVTLFLVPIFTRGFWTSLLPMLGSIALLFYYYGNYTLPDLSAPAAPARAPAPASASETPPGSPPPVPSRSDAAAPNLPPPAPGSQN